VVVWHCEGNLKPTRPFVNGYIRIPPSPIRAIFAGCCAMAIDGDPMARGMGMTYWLEKAEMGESA